MFTYFAEFHEIENQGAGDKRPQIAAHMNIGFDAVAGGFLESYRMEPASNQSPTLVKNRNTWSAPRCATIISTAGKGASSTFMPTFSTGVTRT
jgi:hypothetical protein